MKAKLRSKRGAFLVEFEGENGERGTIWLSYLPSSDVQMIRVSGEHGDGEIVIESQVKRKED